MSLSPTLETYLSDHAVRYTTQHHHPSMSSLETAHRAHVDSGALAKTVVLADERGVVLAVLPASHRLDLERLRFELGRSLHLCAEHEVERLFPDCKTGAVPPLGVAFGYPTVIDSSLEERAEVFFEGGDHETLVCMSGDGFLDLLETAAVAEIACESPSLSAAVVARERLYDTVLVLGRALGAPIGTGTRWRDRVSRALARVEVALEDHIAETESREGLLQEIVDQAPRLWRETEALQSEHALLADECVRVRELIDSPATSSAVRSRAHDLVMRLEEHRHRGADLVYEAYGVDIGGG